MQQVHVTANTPNDLYSVRELMQRSETTPFQSQLFVEMFSPPPPNREVAGSILFPGETETMFMKLWAAALKPSSSYKLIIHYLDRTRWQRAKANKWLVKIVGKKKKKGPNTYFPPELAEKISHE